jgi:hypothetical protein
MSSTLDSEPPNLIGKVRTLSSAFAPGASEIANDSVAGQPAPEVPGARCIGRVEDL